MRQEPEGRELDSAQARVAQRPPRTGTELEDLVKQCRRSSLRGDSRGNALDVLDHRLTEAGSLPRVAQLCERLRARRYESPLG